MYYGPQLGVRHFFQIDVETTLEPGSQACSAAPNHVKLGKFLQILIVHGLRTDSIYIVVAG
jgi:hypothetical protein